MKHLFSLMGTLLLLTAGAKIVSSFGHARILQMSDPMLGVKYVSLFRISGLMELTIAIMCFLSKSIRLKAYLTAWLASGFLIYRLGLAWAGFHKPCPCLGDLTDALHISPHTADTAMKYILAYLLVGSYGTLFWIWRQDKNACTQPTEQN